MWFEGIDTSGLRRFLNLDMASQVIFGVNDFGKPVATVSIDFKSVVFRDPDSLERLRALLTPPLPVEYRPDPNFKRRIDYCGIVKEVEDDSARD